MNNYQFFSYLIIIVLSTYLIRVIPFVAIRKQIKNPFINSFLYYIPYTILAAMTFPFAFYVTSSMVSAIIGIICAILVSLKTKNLTIVAICGCVGVLICEVIMLL